MAVTNAATEASFAVNEKVYREGMIKTGYTPSEIPKIEKQWQCDEETARHAIRKVDFLSLVAEHSAESTLKS